MFFFTAQSHHQSQKHTNYWRAGSAFLSGLNALSREISRFPVLIIIAMASSSIVSLFISNVSDADDIFCRRSLSIFAGYANAVIRRSRAIYRKNLRSNLAYIHFSIACRTCQMTFAIGPSRLTAARSELVLRGGGGENIRLSARRPQGSAFTPRKNRPSPRCVWPLRV